MIALTVALVPLFLVWLTASVVARDLTGIVLSSACLIVLALVAHLRAL